MKKFNRIKQQAQEALGRGEKTDKLTQKLSVVEKKVEGIRNAVQITTKKLSGTIQGSGASVEKHQRKLPQYGLGIGMMEHGSQLGRGSLFGSVLMMVGQAQQDIASQLATYEVTIVTEIIAVLNSMLEEDMKTVDKCKKKLGTARLDMDSARTRMRNLEQQMEKSTREYNMEKLATLRTEVDESTRKFEESQDAYATSMYEFISKEQQYTDKIQQLVKLQITNYKNAAVQLEGMLPIFEKKMNETQDRPVFGLSLDEHLRISKREIAAVLETCCNGLRKEWMDTEGLFRIAGGQSKVKFLKTGFDAGQFDVSTHDPHTIAGCLKMYLRELPEPLLTYDLYSDWLKATGVNDEQVRLKNLWTMKERLPEANLNNFKYLCSFLHEFSQYSDITKMSVNNIAIVIGPNLLWPSEESADPAAMVTETTLQRCLTEMFIEHCHYFFPDLPDPSVPKTTPPGSSITFTASSPSSSSPTSLQSYTSKSPELFSPQLLPVITTEDSESLKDTSSTSSDTKPKEDLPHPLAESAIDEGVTVVLGESTSPKLHQRKSPTPPEVVKSKSLPRFVPPIPTPRTNSSNNLTPPESPSFSHKAPPSPAPRSRQGTGSSTSSASPVVRPWAGGDTPSTAGDRLSDTTHNGRSEEGGGGGVSDHHTPPLRPTPPVRMKRPPNTPPTPAKPPPYSSNTLERKGGTPGTAPRAPMRRAPPPPKSKKPTAPTGTDSGELTSL